MLTCLCTYSDQVVVEMISARGLQHQSLYLSLSDVFIYRIRLHGGGGGGSGIHVRICMSPSAKHIHVYSVYSKMLL
jgi:hypothetical protein